MVIYFCTEWLYWIAVKVELYQPYLAGYITKGCELSAACVNPIKCCQGDLCNSGTPTPSLPAAVLSHHLTLSLRLWKIFYLFLNLSVKRKEGRIHCQYVKSCEWLQIKNYSMKPKQIGKIIPYVLVRKKWVTKKDIKYEKSWAIQYFTWFGLLDLIDYFLLTT